MRTILLIFICVLFIGCVSSSHIKATEIVMLKNVIVVFLGEDSDMLKYDRYDRLLIDGFAVGMADPNINTIYVRGYGPENEISTDNWILGHELLHLLNHKNGNIQNPDHK